MVAGFVVSSLFLACYLVYHYHAGSVPFRGVGPIRLAYYTILLSHTVLAIVVVPLVLLTLVRAARRDGPPPCPDRRVTFPVWLYVSVTGVVDLPDALPAPADFFNRRIDRGSRAIVPIASVREDETYVRDGILNLRRRRRMASGKGPTVAAVARSGCGINPATKLIRSHKGRIQAEEE